MMIIMTTKMVECLYLLTPDLTFEGHWILNYKHEKNFDNLTNNINTTLISLITLTFLIFSTLSWLVLRTLKEGRKALKEINKDSS